MMKKRRAEDVKPHSILRNTFMVLQNETVCRGGGLGHVVPRTIGCT